MCLVFVLPDFFPAIICCNHFDTDYVLTPTPFDLNTYPDVENFLKGNLAKDIIYFNDYNRMQDNWNKLYGLVYMLQITSKIISRHVLSL